MYIELDTSSVLEEVEYTQELGTEIFSIWDTFSTVTLPDLSWVSFQLNEIKVFAQMILSSHLESKSIVFKEIRLEKNKHEVVSLILGKQFGTPQKVTSILHFQTIIDNFHSLVICQGISPMKTHSVVCTMKKGYINLLNRWQSVECKLKIEEPNKNICSKCYLLCRALSEKVLRYLCINYYIIHKHNLK